MTALKGMPSTGRPPAGVPTTVRADLAAARWTWQSRSEGENSIAVRILSEAAQPARTRTVRPFSVLSEVHGSPTAFEDLLHQATRDAIAAGHPRGSAAPHFTPADSSSVAEYRLAEATVTFLSGVDADPHLLSLHRMTLRRGWSWTAHPGRGSISAHVFGPGETELRAPLGQACMSTHNLTLPLTVALARAVRTTFLHTQ